MAKSRVNDRSVTKTYRILANDLAQFPAVETTAQVDLGYSTQFYERTHRTPKPKSLFRRAFEILNPGLWSPAFWFALLVTITLAWISYQGIVLQMRPIQVPLHPHAAILSAMRLTLCSLIPLVLLAFHLTLNYRRRGPGRLIKAYWYAGWVITLFIGVSNPLANAISKHHANRFHDMCFVKRDKANCGNYAEKVYRLAAKKEIVALIPEKRRGAITQMFRLIQEQDQREALAENEDEADEAPAKKTVAAKKANAAKKRLARTLDSSRRLAYGH